MDVFTILFVGWIISRLFSRDERKEERRKSSKRKSHKATWWNQNPTYSDYDQFRRDHQ